MQSRDQKRPGVSGEGENSEISTDLYQTEDRFPIGMPRGENSDHNVNDYVQPTIPVQAVYRLLSQKITEGSNMGEAGFYAMVNDVKTALGKKSKPYHMGTKGGITLFKIRVSAADCYFLTTEPTINESNTESILGILSVGLLNPHVDGVYVRRRYRRQGLGTVLYLAAIHDLGSLRSDTDLGTDACWAWKSVSRYYEVQLIDQDTKLPVDYRWGPNAIPIIKSPGPGSGKAIDKGPNTERYFYFQATK